MVVKEMIAGGGGLGGGVAADLEESEVGSSLLYFFKEK